MEDDRAGIAFEQEILPAPLEANHSLAYGQARDVARHALAQVGVAHGDARDGFPEHEGLDTATGDLDFRQFWHSGNSASLSRLLNIPKLAAQDSNTCHAYPPVFLDRSFRGVAPRRRGACAALCVRVEFTACGRSRGGKRAGIRR